MENFDLNSFDFDSMAQAIGNPFEDAQKKSYKDDRFYVLPKDKEGNGQAIIALLPDAHKHSIIKMMKLSTTLQHGGKKFWINEWSPKTIGLPCPFYETYIKHYNEDPDVAKRFKPQEKWICNIKVINDPANPDNNGKIFLYEMSKTMAKMIEEMLKISDAEKAMGMQRKEVFNPLKGWVLNLKCYKKKENNITYYDTSSFTQLPNGRTIYTMQGGELTDEIKNQCIEEIKTKCYDLGEFQDKKNFKSYEELTEKLESICQGIFGIGGEKTPVKVQVDVPKTEINESVTPQVETQPTQVQVEQKKDDELSALLNSLS